MFTLELVTSSIDCEPEWSGPSGALDVSDEGENLAHYVIAYSHRIIFENDGGRPRN